LAEPGNIDKIKPSTSCNESSAKFIIKIKGKKDPSIIITVNVASSSPFYRYLSNKPGTEYHKYKKTQTGTLSKTFFLIKRFTCKKLQ
jgi:hypothetical protein